jgi:hypothetical protein
MVHTRGGLSSLAADGIYSLNLVEKLSDNSRKASLWTLKGAQNVARGAVSRPFVLQTQALEGARTIYQTVSRETV